MSYMRHLVCMSTAQFSLLSFHHFYPFCFVSLPLFFTILLPSHFLSLPFLSLHVLLCSSPHSFAFPGFSPPFLYFFSFPVFSLLFLLSVLSFLILSSPLFLSWPHLSSPLDVSVTYLLYPFLFSPPFLYFLFFSFLLFSPFFSFPVLFFLPVLSPTVPHFLLSPLTHAHHNRVSAPYKPACSSLGCCWCIRLWVMVSAFSLFFQPGS